MNFIFVLLVIIAVASAAPQWGGFGAGGDFWPAHADARPFRDGFGGLGGFGGSYASANASSGGFGFGR